jgi:hypothetical protein
MDMQVFKLNLRREENPNRKPKTGTFYESIIPHQSHHGGLLLDPVDVRRGLGIQGEVGAFGVAGTGRTRN